GYRQNSGYPQQNYQNNGYPQNQPMNQQNNYQNNGYQNVGNQPVNQMQSAPPQPPQQENFNIEDFELIDDGNVPF
ncbi:MAG: hypothetical protein K2K02_06880, partial [Ruminococcus sp.]|nr:hypothetical protein [Ruminococcus sp.]